MGNCLSGNNEEVLPERNVHQNTLEEFSKTRAPSSVVVPTATRNAPRGPKQYNAASGTVSKTTIPKDIPNSEIFELTERLFEKDENNCAKFFRCDIQHFKNIKRL